MIKNKKNIVNKEAGHCVCPEINNPISDIRPLTSKKGITLIALVVTLVVMLIILSITVALGINGIGETKEDKLKTELGMVQNAVLQQYYKYTVTKKTADLVGTEISAEEVNNVVIEINSRVSEENRITLSEIYGTGKEYSYYRLNSTQLTKIGIKKAKDTYIVNYSTGEVINDSEKVTEFGLALYLRGTSVAGTKPTMAELLQNGTIKIGDYVNYIPNTVNETEVTAMINEFEPYTGYNMIWGNKPSTVSTLTQEEMKWRVLDINGRSVRLISEKPTEGYIFLGGAPGYNNGVYILNKLCDKLYAGEKGVAKSITIEDVENTLDLGVWDYHDYIHSVSDIKYGEIKTYLYSQMYNVWGNVIEYPAMYEMDKYGLLGGIYDKSEQHELIISEQIKKRPESISMTQTLWNNNTLSVANFKNSMHYTLLIKNNILDYKSYFIASRSISSSNNGVVIFGLNGCDPNSGIGGRACTSTSHTDYAAWISLRPVVTLYSNVKIDTSNLDTDGSTPEKAWEFK